MRNDRPSLTEMLEVEAAAICKHYRIELELAREILEQSFASRPSLLRKMAEHAPQTDVTRLHEYKEAIKEARKQIYYSLRRYHRDTERESQLKGNLADLIQQHAAPGEIKQVADELLQIHISTQERFPSYQAFYEALFALVPPPSSIIDIGCGLHPLSYPFQKEGKQTERYVAIDKDRQAIDILETFAPSVTSAQLLPRCENIAHLGQNDYFVNDLDCYDLAFMLKLIPVISRQNKAVLPTLAQVPARRLLVTASTTAMTRDEAIARREDHMLHQFIAMTGRPILQSFSIVNEFGYILGQ